MLHFGKYRNQALKEVIKKDKQYLEWLNTQPWFTIKFKDLHHQTTHLLNDNLTPIKTNDAFVIYTDGACSHNGSKFAKAGIGVHFSPNNKIKLEDISSRLHIDKPTNNKAELIAIKEALDLWQEVYHFGADYHDAYVDSFDEIFKYHYVGDEEEELI